MVDGWNPILKGFGWDLVVKLPGHRESVISDVSRNFTGQSRDFFLRDFCVIFVRRISFGFPEV